MKKIIIPMLFAFFCFCSKQILYFDQFNYKNERDLKGKYYCKLPGIWICGQTYAVVEFDTNFNANVKTYYECKDIYFRLFEETIHFNKINGEYFKYRGNYCDIIKKEDQLYLFINYNSKTEILEMQRNTISDSLMNCIIKKSQNDFRK